MVRAAAERSVDAKIIYLWGGDSSGKSHLLSAACASSPSAIALFAPLPVELPTATLLAIDDVDNLDETDQIRLFNLINLIQAPDCDVTLLAAGHTSPGNLVMRRDLSTRLGSGLVYQLHPLSDDEKTHALHVHAKARGFALHTDVATYLLRHVRRDMRSLIAMLDTLDRYSLETGRNITVPLLKQATQNLTS